MFRKKIDFDLNEFRSRPLPTEQEITARWTGDLEKPVVSVICNTYNQEMYIEDAIRGFLIQETDFPFEVIINDDASTDRNPEIIASYVRKYPKIIKPIFQNVNQYSQGKKPTILSFTKASGRYIALCEGDDFWVYRKKLQLQHDHLKKNILVKGCAHSALAFYPKGHFKIINDYETYNLSCDFVIRRGGGVVPTASIFIRRSVLKEFSKNFANAPLGDYFIQALAAEAEGLDFVNEVWSIYRYASETSVSQAEKKKDSQRIRNFVGQFESALENLERVLGESHTDSIRIFKSSMYKEASIRALVYSDDKKLFRELSDLSNDVVVSRTHKFILIFSRCPMIIKYAYRLREFFGR